MNISVQPLYDLFSKFVCFNRISSFLFCFSFFLWVGSFSPSPLTSAGPPQCLNSEPGSEPGVNRGLCSLFWGYASDLSYFSFLYSLCFKPVPLHSPQGYAFPRAISSLGTLFCVLLQSEPFPFVGPLPPPFSLPRTLAFLRPK